MVFRIGKRSECFLNGFDVGLLQKIHRHFGHTGGFSIGHKNGSDIVQVCWQLDFFYKYLAPVVGFGVTDQWFSGIVDL